MGLFNKKPKTAEDILKLIQDLPEDEFDKLSDMLLTDENDNGKPDTMEQIDKAEEDIEAKGEDTQTEEDRIDESVAEQEKAEGEEDSQDAKDRVDEAEGEEEHLEEEKEEEAEPVAEETEETVEETEEEPIEDEKDKVIEALTQRLAALEERVATIVSNAHKGTFGNHSPEVTELESDGRTEDSKVMQSYYRKQTIR